MITEALTELGGTSGRAAITGFILGRFTGLPATHDAFLSAHLHRLVSEGVVRSFASTYIFPALPRPGPARTPSQRRRPRICWISIWIHLEAYKPAAMMTTPSVMMMRMTTLVMTMMMNTLLRVQHTCWEQSAAPAVATLDSSTTKRGRVRPRKEPEATSRNIKRGPGHSRKDASPFPASALATKPKKLLDLNLDPSQGLQISSDDDEDVYSGGGDDDDDVDYTPMLGAMRGRGRPQTRGRGWPRKDVLCANGGGASSPLTKRGRGRPRKRQNVCPSEASFQNGGDTTPMQTLGGDFSTPKRGRGRPTKETESTSTSIQRGRGRPRKDEQSQADSFPTGSKKSEMAGSKGPSE